MHIPAYLAKDFLQITFLTQTMMQAESVLTFHLSLFPLNISIRKPEEVIFFQHDAVAVGDIRIAIFSQVLALGSFSKAWRFSGSSDFPILVRGELILVAWL